MFKNVYFELRLLFFENLSNAVLYLNVLFCLGLIISCITSYIYGIIDNAHLHCLFYAVHFKCED